MTQWTRQQLIESAGIVTGLSPAEIGSLQLHDIESISAVGNNGLWTSTQVSDITVKTHKMVAKAS